MSEEDEITARELEVLRLVVEGLGNRQIAVALGLSQRTVDAHVRNAMKKTKTASRTQLAVFALRSGVVPLSPDAKCTSDE
jgi:DNA-binding NarL/FixJ family response regulator